MKLLYLSLLPFLLFMHVAIAQDQSHLQNLELGADFGAGVSKINVKTTDYSTQFGFNVQGQLHATYFFTKDLGVTLGLGFNQINATTLAHDFRDVVLASSDLTGNYQVIAYSNDYQETQQINFFELPIGITYKQQLNERFSLRSGMGIKLGFPLGSSFQLDKGISTRLYYLDLMASEDNAIRNIPSWGLYEDYTDWDNASGELDASLNLALYANAGIMYKINDDLGLTASLYFAYGLNDPIKNTQSQLLASTAPNVYSYNSPTTFTDNNTLEMGLKVGIVYSLKNFRPKRVVAKQIHILPNKEQNTNPPILAEPEPQKQKVDSLYSPVETLLPKDTVVEKTDTVALLAIASADVTDEELAKLNRLASRMTVNGIHLSELETIALRRDSAIVFVEETEVNFAFNSSQINPELIPQLNKLIAIVIEQDLHIIVEGHTDERGDSIVNLKYSQRRADIVAKYLRDGGVAKDQITTVAKGESEPLIKNATRLVDHQKNRRVVLIVVNKDD